MKRSVIIIVVLIVIVGIAVSIGVIIRKRMSGAIEVQVEPVSKRDISQIVTSFGRISPRVEVDISSQVIGKIEDIFIDEGDTVKKGDLLVELEKTRYRSSVSSAEASLRSARSQVTQVEANLTQATDTHRKQKTMFDKGLTSEDALKRAATEVEILEAQLASAQEGVERAKAALDEALDQLGWTTIKAPVSGVIINLVAEEGENVITGTMNIQGSMIMTIAQLDAMEAVVDVDEADIVDLEIGQEVKVEVDAFPDTFMVGQVTKIANTASLQNIGGQETVANFEVRIAVDSPLEGIRPGMSCSAEIEVDHADSSLSVPIQAVVAARKPAERPEAKRSSSVNKANKRPSQQGNGFGKMEEAVFIVEDGVAKQRIVQTGIADDRYIEVKNGVKNGEMVVIGRYQALRDLQDGDRVRSESQGSSMGRRFEGNVGSD